MREPAPKTNAETAALVAATQARLESQELEIAQLRTENKLLRQKVDFLTRRLFGKSSEKGNLDQLMLSLTEESANEPARPPLSAPEPLPAPQPRRARGPVQNRLPEDLPEERVILDPPEVEAAPEEFRCIGEEVHVELDVTPTRYVRRVTVRRKYVRKDDRQAAPIVAPAPKRLIENSLASPGLLTHVVVGKYVDHLPLYRQSRIFWRDRIRLSRKTLSDWMMQVGNWLEPIAEAVAAEIRATGYVQADETVIRYQDPGRGSARQGYLWTLLAPGVGVRYEWHTSREASCLETLLRGYAGGVHCDGYAGYPAYNQTRPEGRRLELLACWAHVRRKFFEAKEDSAFARWMVGQIGKLYAVEARLREQRAGPKLRAAVRGAECRMILNRIGRALRGRDLARTHLPQSPTGKAITYALGLWDALQVYVERGEAEIDNNLVENAIRPTAIGKKNYLFFGSGEAGVQSAAIYTLVQTCQLLGVDVREYLTDILRTLPHATNQTIAALTPARWRDAKLQAQRLAA